jgi:hypothetical protein
MGSKKLSAIYWGKNPEKFLPLAETVYNRYINAETIYPMILMDGRATSDALKIAGALYHSALSSLRFGQYRRAIWYLGAFDRWCRKTLNQEKSDLARMRINREILK